MSSGVASSEFSPKLFALALATPVRTPMQCLEAAKKRQPATSENGNRSSSGGIRKPSDGLEPSTLSLPWQPVAADGNGGQVRGLGQG